MCGGREVDLRICTCDDVNVQSTLEAILSHDTAAIIPLTSDTPRVRQHVLRSPVARHHRPRKSAWHRDITEVIRHTVCPPHTRSNPSTRYRQSSRSAATRRVYASMFRAPQWHGATQTHFPPRPRKSAWHCDITNVIRHTVCPHTRSNHITLEANTSESSSTNCPLLKGSFPTSWPLLSPAPKSFFKSSSEKRPKLTLTCISRPRHARSSQRVAPDQAKTHSHLHFAPSTHTISAEWLRRTGPKRTLACTSRPRHARSPQRVAPDRAKTHSRLHFAPSTRTMSAEGCAGPGQNALSPALRALDTHDLRRGLRRTGPKRTLACISRPRHARCPQRVAFRGAPAAPPPALREKVKKSER